MPDPTGLAGVPLLTPTEVHDDFSSAKALMKTLTKGVVPSQGSTRGAQVPMPPGLPFLHNKLVAQIIANEYVDFSELPPAKGRVKALPQAYEGKIAVIQVADLYQHRKLIPDFATWAQCFALYRQWWPSKPSASAGLYSLNDHHLEGQSQI